MKIGTYSFLTNPDRVNQLLGDLGPLQPQLGRKFIIAKYQGDLRVFKLEIDYDTSHASFTKNEPVTTTLGRLDGLTIVTDKIVKAKIKPTKRITNAWWSFGETEYQFKYRYTWKA